MTGTASIYNQFLIHLYFTYNFKQEILQQQSKKDLLKMQKENPSQQKKEIETNHINEMNRIAKILEEKIEPYIFNTQNIDQIYMQGLRNIMMLKNLLNDILLITTTREELRMTFIESRGYLKTYASQIVTKKINIKWYNKLLEEILLVFIDIEKVNVQSTATLYLLFDKLKMYLKFFQYAVTFDQEDIFNLEKSHEKWIAMKVFLRHKIIRPRSQIQDAIKKITLINNASYAINQKSGNMADSLEKGLKQTLGTLYYLVNSQERQKKSVQFKSNLKLNKVISLFEFAENNVITNIFKLNLKTIEYIKNIFITRASRTITPEIITQILKEQNINAQQTNNNNTNNSEYIFFNQQKKIQVRVLANTNIQKKIDQEEDNYDQQFVMIHVHGGGFIAQTPKYHEIYTRRWAKQCNIPIFSINYRKAPQFPFPDALDDIWQIYNWVIKESHRYFKIKKNKKILLIGDSAGGNLIFSLTNLCIYYKITLPYIILGFYPILHCNVKKFTPSFLNSFYDPLLSFQILEFCIENYVGKASNRDTNYILSPFITPDHFLKKYPPTYLFVGEKDILYDDIIRFAYRLFNNDGKVQVTAYDDMIHDFLKLSYPGGINCLDDSISLILQIKQNLII